MTTYYSRQKAKEKHRPFLPTLYVHEHFETLLCSVFRLSEFASYIETVLLSLPSHGAQQCYFASVSKLCI